jgi:cystathionine beta-lyase/cystathionine gamma-synthase
MFNDDLVIDPESGLYNRCNYTNLDKLNINLSKLYNCNNVLVTTSGIHSISTIILGLKNQYKLENINIIFSDNIYWESELIFNEYNKNESNIFLHKINDISIDYFNKFLKDQNNILFVESCSNPFGDIFDFRIIPELRKLSNKLTVIVDNTWLTSIIFNPFDWDVDCIAISLTKYYSGGSAIAGSCLFRDSTLYEICKINNTIMGIHISPVNIEIVNKNIINLKDRMIKSSNLLKKVVEEIKNNDNIKFIYNPYLNTNDSHELSKIFFNKHNLDTLYPPILSISFYDFDKVYEIIKKINILENKTSFGSKYTRIDSWYDNKCCRVAIGYDDNIERILLGLNEIIN